MKPIEATVKLFVFYLTIALFMQCSNSSNTENQEGEQGGQKRVNEEIFHKKHSFDGESLNEWEVTKFGTQGTVSILDDKIILNYGDGCTGVTSTMNIPKINYEVVLDARRISGNDFFCGMTFPVKDQFCSLIVGGWGGSLVGLSNVDGEDASNNATKVSKQFEMGTWYAIKLKVTDEKIEVWIDNKKLVNFAHEFHELSIRPEMNLSKPFGICSWNTTAELRNIHMKKIQ